MTWDVSNALDLTLPWTHHSNSREILRLIFC